MSAELDNRTVGSDPSFVEVAISSTILEEYEADDFFRGRVLPRKAGFKDLNAHVFLLPPDVAAWALEEAIARRAAATRGGLRKSLGVHIERLRSAICVASERPSRFAMLQPHSLEDSTDWNEKPRRVLVGTAEQMRAYGIIGSLPGDSDYRRSDALVAPGAQRIISVRRTSRVFAEYRVVLELGAADTEAEDSFRPLYRAMLVPQEQLPEAQKVARFFRRLGIAREAFCSAAEAREWELNQVRLWGHR
jgi:hypothetical protein